MYGGKVSLLVGIAAGVLATVVGTLWGSVAGYVGGWVDAVMMRIVDAGIAIPALFILLVISAITTPGVGGLIVDGLGVVAADLLGALLLLVGAALFGASNRVERG